MTMQPYEYAIVKYVHDPVAGECLNIGVLLLSVTPENSIFAGKFDSRYARLSEAFAGFDGEHYRKFVYRLQRDVERQNVRLGESALFPEEPPSLSSLLAKLFPDTGMGFQYHTLMAGITHDPTAELEHLFARFISSQYEREQVNNRDGSGLECISPTVEDPSSS